MPGCRSRCGPPRSGSPPVRTGLRRGWPGGTDPALRLGELRTGDLDVGRVLGSALRARPHGERHLAGVPASAADGTFTAAEAAGEAGLSADTAEELLERLIEGALLEMAGIDAEGRPRYRFHEPVRLATLTETAGRTADRRLTAAG
ncbi:hypothetical protein [Streptomyces sp. Root369]|uniref:hypothetical protein n=1 Tax=Streptomyces sp. Root369 TaxID=1736523 RepID=UPI00070AAB70|nr:hypothetical protein [Streptomyces sp. Root369]KQW16330.1 hypothetical protein ASD08_25240 [Streptomyces sp. Root369]